MYDVVLGRFGLAASVSFFYLQDEEALQVDRFSGFAFSCTSFIIPACFCVRRFFIFQRASTQIFRSRTVRLGFSWRVMRRRPFFVFVLGCNVGCGGTVSSTMTSSEDLQISGRSFACVFRCGCGSISSRALICVGRFLDTG